MADIPAPTASVFRIAIRTLYTDAAYQDSPAVIEDTIARVGEIFTIIAGDPSTQFSSAVAFQVKTKIGPALLQSWEPVVYIINSAGKSLLASRRGLKVDPSGTGLTAVQGVSQFSEVYLNASYHDSSETLANTIIHEIMHNKLNMGDAMHNLAGFVGDIGGFMQESLPSNKDLKPSAADTSNVAPVLSSVLAQQIGI